MKPQITPSIDPKPLYLYEPEEVEKILWNVFKGGADKIEFVSKDENGNLDFVITPNTFDEEELEVEGSTFDTLEMFEDMGHTQTEYHDGKFFVKFLKGEMNKEILKNGVIKESVRHGVFPWFTIDRNTLEIKFGECDNDLAQEAFWEDTHDSKTVYGICRSDWSRIQCQGTAAKALELIKQGKTNKEIDGILGGTYDEGKKSDKDILTEGRAEDAIVSYLQKNPGASSKEIIKAVYGRDADELKGSALLMAPSRAIARAIQVGSVIKDGSTPNKYYAKGSSVKPSVEPEKVKVTPANKKLGVIKKEPVVALTGEAAVLDLLTKSGKRGITAKEFTPFFKSLIHSVPVMQSLLKSGKVVRDSSQRPALWYLSGNQPTTADVSIKPKVVRKRSKEDLIEAIKTSSLRYKKEFKFNDEDYAPEVWENNSGGFQVYIPTLSRGPRTDHHGGEDGEGWMSSSEIRRVAAPYEKYYKPIVKDLIRDLREKKFKVTDYNIEYGEKGHISIELIIGGNIKKESVVKENKDYTSSYPAIDNQSQSFIMLSLAIGEAKRHDQDLNNIGRLTEEDEDKMVVAGTSVLEGKKSAEAYTKELISIFKKITKKKELSEESFMKDQIELRIKGNSSKPILKNK